MPSFNSPSPLRSASWTATSSRYVLMNHEWSCTFFVSFIPHDRSESPHASHCYLHHLCGLSGEHTFCAIATTTIGRSAVRGCPKQYIRKLGEQRRGRSSRFRHQEQSSIRQADRYVEIRAGSATRSRSGNCR